MKMSNKTYDILVWIVQVILPALGTFYFAIASIWGLPFAEQIVGTITALATLLGTILKISKARYTRDSEREAINNAIQQEMEG